MPHGFRKPVPGGYARHAHAKRKSPYHHAYCVRDKALWIRAELRAHQEMALHGESPKYKAAERASERAFNLAYKAGCAWTRRSRS